MKKLTFFSVILFLFSGLLAQEISQSKQIPTTYDRSSLTVIFVDFSTGNYWEQAKAKIDQVVFSDKYDNNNLDALLLKPSFSRSAIPDNNMQKALLNDLMSIAAGKLIISKWYNRKPDGIMDMELVHHRGRFTATDADFLLAQTSRRGNAALEDYGNRLINLSHILVIDINEIKTMAEAGVSGMKGWRANATGYLFRIDFNDEIRNAFYDTWIYDDDSQSAKEQKRKAFDALQIPIIPVTQKVVSLTSSQPESDKGLGLFFKPKSTDELLGELVQKAYDDVVYRIEMDVEEFKVKTALFSTRPLGAKIGLKEGLKTDTRFFVYEYVYNTRTNEAEPRRRGVIRASSKSKIIDNRREAAGDMGTSRFYQVHGRRLQPGFTLQQQNDFGLELSLGAEIGGLSGFYGRLDVRSGRFSGIRALFVYLEGGIDAGDYYGETFAFLRYGAGFAKGFQLTRNVELRPYIGFGAEQASSETYSGDDALTALYIRPGANLALNLKHNIQIVGGMGAYVFISDAEDKNGYMYGAWDDFFDGRSGPSAFVGLKIGF